MAENLYFDTSEVNNIDAMAVETDPTIATPLNVKNGYVFTDAVTREPLVGTMTINNSENIKINPKSYRNSDDSYTIPKGYHDGTGKVYTGNLSEYTTGTALPEDVVFNKVFWVNGERRVGTLDLEENTQEGTANASDLIEGKTAWVNKQKITGTIPKLPRKDKTLLASESYTIPYGLSVGTTVISAASLASQTPGTASASNIVTGKTAWVNGEKIVGNFDISEDIREYLVDTNTFQSHVLSGKKFYSSVYGEIESGTMENHTGDPLRIIEIGQEFLIPQGYYDGNSAIITKSLEESTQASASSSDILNSKTAWVNGEKINGNIATHNITKVRISAGNYITLPPGYYPEGITIYSLVLDQLDLSGTDAVYLNQVLYPNSTGYVDGENLIVTV